MHPFNTAQAEHVGPLTIATHAKCRRLLRLGPLLPVFKLGSPRGSLLQRMCARHAKAFQYYVHLQDERLHDALEALRAKFKAVISMLGRSTEYLPKGEGPQLTF